MFSQIVGTVDWNSAAVLMVLFITLCIVSTAGIAKRRSRRELQMQFEIDKLKLLNADKENERVNQRQHEIEMTKLAFDKDVQYKRIDSGLIEGTKVVNNHHNG